MLNGKVKLGQYQAVGSGSTAPTACAVLFITFVTLALMGCVESDPGSGRELSLTTAPPTAGPLQVAIANSRYFSDAKGHVVVLSGSHTWHNFQDAGYDDPPPVFDYGQYLDDMERFGHNYVRLWRWEQAWGNAEVEGEYYFSPQPYLRVGPGLASDGKPRFDLDRFNDAYFQRLRNRVEEAGRRGLYVSVMLFNGWSVTHKDLGFGNPWTGHPFRAVNNINGIDADLDGDEIGLESHTLAVPEITRLQEAYVRRVVEAVEGLDHVMFEITNESHPDSDAWQEHMVQYLNELLETRGEPRPVGRTVTHRGGTNPALWASTAVWVSPRGSVNNPVLGQGDKVVLHDTDHLCGVCGDEMWAWKSFLRGLNPIFMDPYFGSTSARILREDWFDEDDERWHRIRVALGQIRTLSERLDLAAMRPHPELSSTGYALAAPTSEAPEFLVLAPDGGGFEIDLSAVFVELRAEWADLSRNRMVGGEVLHGGGPIQVQAPFRGPALLYLQPMEW